MKLVVLDTALPSSVGIPQLGQAHPTFLEGSRVFNVTKDGGAVVSVVEFNKHEQGEVDINKLNWICKMHCGKFCHF